MKIAGAIVLAVLLAAVLVSGCVQRTEGPPTTGELTQGQAEEQAYQALEQEMEESLEDMTLEELEDELLQQG